MIKSSVISAFAVLGLAFSSCKSKSQTDAAPAKSASPPASISAALPSAPSAAPHVRPADAIAEVGGSTLSLVSDETTLFWVSSGYNRTPKGIFSAPKAGGEPTKLADVQQALGAWATKGHLYFYDAGPRLWAMAKNGGKAVSVAESDYLGPAAADGDTFCWIGAPAAGASAKPAAAAASAKPRAPVAGGSAKPGAVLDSDRRTLYCKKDDAARGLAVAPVTLFSQQLLVSGDQVFWGSSVDLNIQAAPVSGGPTRVVAKDVKGLGALAANKSSLFFIGVHGTDKGIFELDKKGGTPRKLAPIATEWARDLTADETHVYYIFNRGLFGVSIKGGKPSPLFAGDVKLPKGLLVDDTSLYTADGTFLRRLKKPSP